MDLIRDDVKVSWLGMHGMNPSEHNASYCPGCGQRVIGEEPWRNEDGEDGDGMIDLTGVELIAKERQRQIEGEGWTAEHDDQHDNGQMATAAACYALHDVVSLVPEGEIVPRWWPWDDGWWKPSNQVRNLVKAGALIAAEIDRLLRQENVGRGVGDE